MGKKVCLAVIAIFTFIVKSESLFADEDDITELEVNRKGFHIGPLSDYCSWSNRSCTCCMQNDNGQGCAIFNLIESNGTNGESNYTLQLVVQVENSVLLTEYLQLSRDNLMCYDIEDIGVCGKLVPNKQDTGVEVCSFVEFRINQHAVQELKMYCVEFPNAVNKVGGVAGGEDLDQEEKRRRKDDKKKVESTPRPPLIPPMPFIPFIPWAA